MALTPDQCRAWRVRARRDEARDRAVWRFADTPEPFGVLLFVGLAVACGAWAAITGRA